MRNKKIHGEDILSIQDLCHNVQKATRLYYKAVAARKEYPLTCLEHQRWNPPPVGFKKINFDAAYGDMQAHVGIVMQDAYKTIITAWNGRFIASSPFALEAKATLQVMKLGDNLGLHNIIIEGDAMNVINALKGDDTSIEWQGRQAIMQGR